ncbi:MAG: DUF2914 domain-containing protein [Thermodesulfobacteriota bacterium]|nr:DUF2914 domain-containing protein [Thermodesulfobacteriota bacterium]
MENLFSRLFSIALAIICFTLPTGSPAQEAVQLEVDISAICEDVINFEPTVPRVSFPVTIGRLCCFTRILGANEPTTITHLWYYGKVERARVELIIKGSPWRTYSSKIIQPHEVGSWRVEVLDQEGMVLKVIQFITTSGEEPSEAQAVEPEMAPGTTEMFAPPETEGKVDQPAE